jgi:hypothetical protein
MAGPRSLEGPASGLTRAGIYNTSCGWEENYLKYAAANYGIDRICEYAVGIEARTKIVDNPTRKKANAAERGLLVVLTDPASCQARRA